MKTTRCLASFGLLVCVLFVGCGKGVDAAKVYDVKGKVVAINVKKKMVTLNHEALPGILEARKTRFDVESAQTLEGIKAGDAVSGKLKVAPGIHTIMELNKR